MGPQYDLKINAIEAIEFQAFLLKKHPTLLYGYLSNRTLDIMDRAFDHAEQGNSVDNNYYNIMIDDVTVAVVAITYQDDCITR
ncbi:MAG: hypothetical protein GY710_14755 [Desulfobacteraceae bacterium]|nr:hypothetical protein [Desulfobacteraceae bacterium]